MKGHRKAGLTKALAALLLVGGLMLPLASPDAQAVRNPNINDFNVANLAPAYVAPGLANVSILTFTLRDGVFGGEYLTRVIVNYTGTNLSDIVAVKIFNESGPTGGSFDNSTDNLKAVNSSITSNPIYLNLSNYLPRIIRVQFYLVVDISPNATDNNTIDARIDQDALLINNMTWPDFPYNPPGSARLDAFYPANWTDFQPTGWQPANIPSCTVWISDNASGLAVNTSECRHSDNNGTDWTNWTAANCTGLNGTTAVQNITAFNLSFKNDSASGDLVQFRIKDVAGNIGTSPPYAVKIDTTGPTGWTLLAPAGWYTADQRPNVTVSVQDDLSGMANATVWANFSTDGGTSWSPFNCSVSGGPASVNITALSVPFDRDNASANLIRFNASDMVGNFNSSPPMAVKIDSSPPDAPSMQPEPQYTQGTANNVSWNALADPVSGLMRYRVLCDPDPAFPAPLEAELGNATSYEFANLTDGVRYFYKVAQSNNAGLPSNYSIVVNSTQDSSAPFTTAATRPQSPDGENGWFVNATIVDLFATDNSSGVAFTRYSVDSGGTVDGTQLNLSTDGEYTIHFWSEDNVGNSEQPRTIVVRIDMTPPVAAIQAAGTAYQNDTVRFDASASAGAENYSWDFGDGSAPAEGANVFHAYSQAGTFTVTLATKDRAGLTCVTHAEIKVLEKGVNYPPVADIGTIPTIYVGKAATFDGSKSTDENNPALTYDWEFGDGSTGTGVRVTHTYSAAGTYSLKLKVTDAGGLYDMDSREVRVFSEGQNQPPLGHISQANVAYVGEPVLLDASNSSDEDISTVVFAWDFGDGSVATGMMVTHTYGNESIYLVRLNLTDGQGLKGSTEIAVRVFVRGTNLAPIAQFTFFPNDPRARQTVEFDASLSTDEDPFTLNFTWDFGDGAGAQGKIAAHAFPRQGEYEVKLRVRDRGSLTDTYSYRISVAKSNATGPGPVNQSQWWPWAAAAVVAVVVAVPLVYIASRGRKKKEEPFIEEAAAEQPSHAAEGPASLVAPQPADQATPPMVVETGLNYLMDADQPTVAYNALAKLTSEGAKGLMFTPVHPKKVLKSAQLTDIEIIWLSDIMGDEPSMDPSKMDYEIAEKAISFIKEYRDKGVVLIDGLELLMQTHGFEKVLQFVHGITEVASVNEATVLVNIHSKAMKDVEFNQLKRKFDRW